MLSIRHSGNSITALRDSSLYSKR